MKIQINSDKQVVVDTELSGAFEAYVRLALARFETRLTRLEIHLSDTNSSSKRGLRDKRCLLEARPVRQKPVSVVFEAASVEQAVHGAAGKMKRLLETSFGKSSDQTLQRPARQTKGDISSPAAIEKLQHVPTVSRRASTAIKKSTSEAKPTSAGGRSPKKKMIYRARRKAWPNR